MLLESLQAEVLLLLLSEDSHTSIPAVEYCIQQARCTTSPARGAHVQPLRQSLQLGRVLLVPLLAQVLLLLLLLPRTSQSSSSLCTRSAASSLQEQSSQPGAHLHALGQSLQLGLLLLLPLQAQVLQGG